MRKARVWRPSKFHRWAFSLEPDDMHGVIYGYVATHAEAMFLAQLLADPHEYIRAAKERAWEVGFDAGEKDAFSHQTFDEPCIPNPYRKEDQ